MCPRTHAATSSRAADSRRADFSRSPQGRRSLPLAHRRLRDPFPYTLPRAARLRPIRDRSQSLDRRTSCLRVIGLGVSLPLLGCALGLHEPVQVIVVGIDSLPSEGMEMRVAVKLRVQNPNDAALDFDGVAMTLEVRGSTFASGVSEARGSVPRFGETVIVVP